MAIKSRPSKYYDDPLTGPPPVLKKPSSLVTQTTMFPPPIPVSANDMDRFSKKPPHSSINTNDNDEKQSSVQSTTWGETICAPFGFAGAKYDKKILKSQEKNHYETIKNLEQTLSDIYKDRTKQLQELYTAQTHMTRIEQEILDYQATSGLSERDPIFLSKCQTYDQWAKQHKLTQQFLKQLSDREIETKQLLLNYQTEGHSQKLRTVVLQHNKTSQKLGIDKKQMDEILKVNEIRERQIVRNEASSSFIPDSSSTFINIEHSDDVNQMLKRCSDRLQKFNNGSGGRRHLPPPPPPPSEDDIHPPDMNMQIHDNNDEKKENVL
jgi:hypothetical protein